MNTFLPYPNFKRSARVLDNKRLGKQRVEVIQIFNALTDPRKGWKNHPATLMWKGYELALLVYGMEISLEWIRRGFKDTTYRTFVSLWLDHNPFSSDPTIFPPWLGNRRVHSAYKSNLLRKDPVHYGKYGWTVPHNLEYVWPTKEGLME